MHVFHSPVSLDSSPFFFVDLGENMSDTELQEMFDLGDTDGDGVVNEDEFIRIMDQMKQQ